MGHRKRTRAGELPAWDPPGASGCCAEPGLARHLFETKSGSGLVFLFRDLNDLKMLESHVLLL